MAVAGRRTWVIAPKEDIDLGESNPDATLSVVEENGRIQVLVSAPEPPPAR